MKKKQITGEVQLYQYSALWVILIPFILYISAIRLGFVYFDDDILILDNFEKLSHFKNLGLAFHSDAFFSNMSPYYRPLMNVSFMVDAAIGGKMPAMFHFSNLVYHLGSCVTLLWLLTLMGFSKPKALAGTLLFSVHPMMGHAVLWIPARGDLLVTLFALLAFAMFLRFLRDKKVHFLLLHLLCLTAAIFSKESAVFLPLLFIFWLVIRKERIFDRRMFVVYIGWLVIFSFWYYMRMITIEQHSDGQQGISSMIRNLPFLPEAVARFFFPFMLPVTPVFSWVYTLSGVVAAIAVIVFIFRYKTRENLPLIIFGALWFLGFCLPNMFVRLVSADDSFEYLLHRTYLPYVGFLIMLLSVLPDKWFVLRSKPYNIIFASVLVILSVTSVLQQNKYLNASEYWGSSVKYAPSKAWFHYYLGRYYFKQKDYVNFGKYLQTADSLKSYPEFQYHMGMVALQDKKQLERAYGYFKQAFSKGYGGTEAHANFVTLCIESSSDYFQRGSYAMAISRCEEALANDPNNSVAAYNLGIYLVNAGQKPRAAYMWRRAILLNPGLTEAYRSLCLYYIYDAKKADSAAWFAREFNNHGGTGNLISP
ncbi:MAG: tetratricopeptide repeat protein [Bacteroidales bacterium]